MSLQKPPRPGEVRITLPESFDAGVHFIGRIRSPWHETGQCPRNSRAAREVVASIELDPLYAQGLQDLALFSHAIALYWMHEARRDLIAQVPSHMTHPRGTFALRSPVRPNPIGLSVVEIVSIEGTTLRVRNMDCLDGTPLIDVKPYYASLDSEPHARRPG